MLRAKVFDVCFGRDEKSIFNNIYVVRKPSLVKQCTLFLTFLDGILQMRADEIPSEKLERGSKKVKPYLYYYDK